MKGFGTSKNVCKGDSLTPYKSHTPPKTRPVEGGSVFDTVLFGLVDITKVILRVPFTIT